MDTDSYPDPIQDAASRGLQRAMQVASCAVTATQITIHQLKTQARAVAERDERARRALHAEIRADKDAARVFWAPALDPRWLRHADLYQTARAWGAAVPYADRSVPWYEPTAATALRKTEDRLRELHPYAMAHYDRLRANGRTPAEAMREAAPLFAREPQPRDAASVPRPALKAAGTAGPEPAADSPAASTDAPGDQPGHEALAERGQQIASDLQQRARSEGREALGEAELRTVLETVTNLPADVINDVARSAGARQRHQPRPRPAGDTRPWQHDFPVPIREVVATSAGQSAPTAPSQTAAVVRRTVQQPSGAPRS